MRVKALTGQLHRKPWLALILLPLVLPPRGLAVAVRVKVREIKLESGTQAAATKNKTTGN